MLLFADLNFTIASVLPGETVDREIVKETLSALSQKLVAPEEFKARLLVPQLNAIDQWWESRLALCKGAKGVAGPLFASISHTNGISVAAVCSAVPGLMGIGIDIERLDRRISPRAASRIQRLVPDSEEPELLRWVRYESAYKATYGYGELISVASDSFVTTESEIGTELRSIDEFVFAVAISRNITVNS